MDIQLKKGILEACVLTSLKNEESYGYKIISDLSPHIEISESTLYPILKRLESDSYLTTRAVEHNGRLRKYYMITQAGKNRIKEFIVEMEDITKLYQYICREGR